MFRTGILYVFSNKIKLVSLIFFMFLLKTAGPKIRDLPFKYALNTPPLKQLIGLLKNKTKQKKLVKWWQKV